VGGGGQGGGAKAPAAGQASVGAGGGAGAYAASWVTGITGTYAVTIGAGGTGAAAGLAGNAGGDTIFGANLVVAKGGAGGGAGTAVGTVTIGVGGGWTGSGNTGDVSIYGDQGGTGMVIASAGTVQMIWGGDGAGSIFAKRLAGPALWFAGNNAGNGGIGYGGGACGGVAFGAVAATVGSNGAAGAMRVWEYF
jgi:hypothetical protein